MRVKGCDARTVIDNDSDPPAAAKRAGADHGSASRGRDGCPDRSQYVESRVEAHAAYAKPISEDCRRDRPEERRRQCRRGHTKGCERRSSRDAVGDKAAPTLKQPEGALHVQRETSVE